MLAFLRLLLFSTKFRSFRLIKILSVTDVFLYVGSQIYPKKSQYESIRLLKMITYLLLKLTFPHLQWKTLADTTNQKHHQWQHKRHRVPPGVKRWDTSLRKHFTKSLIMKNDPINLFYKTNGPDSVKTISVIQDEAGLRDWLFQVYRDWRHLTKYNAGSWNEMFAVIGVIGTTGTF